jgi:hypothetical protein
MRKILTSIVIVSLVLALSACGSTDSIEITQDNWEDYFEVKLIVEESKNAFDEVEMIYLQNIFTLKDDYTDRFKDADIAVEFEETCTSVCSIEYNTETKELIIGEPFSESEMDAHSYSLDLDLVTGTENYDKTAYKSEKEGWGYGCTLGAGHGGYDGSYEVNGNIITMDGHTYSIEITRIQGTLVLK